LPWAIFDAREGTGKTLLDHKGDRYGLGGERTPYLELDTDDLNITRRKMGGKGKEGKRALISFCTPKTLERLQKMGSNQAFILWGG